MDTQSTASGGADVLFYLIRISDKLGIDLIVAANAKIILNAAKYPVHQLE